MEQAKELYGKLDSTIVFRREQSKLSEYIDLGKIETILEMANTLEETISSLTFVQLNQEIDTIENYVQLLYEVSKTAEHRKKENIQLLLSAKKILIILADLYEQNGCIGIAFDYLVKVINPNFNTVDGNETKVEADYTTFMLAIEFDIAQSRRIFLYYCSTYFNVISVLGHALEEAIETYQNSRIYARIENAEEIDIKYWSSVSSVLFKSKNDKLTDVANILQNFLISEHNASRRFIIIEALLRNTYISSHEKAALFKEARSLRVYGVKNVVKKALKFWSCLLISPVNTQNVRENFLELLNLIIDAYPDKVLQRLQKTRVSWVINEMIFQLLFRGNYYNLAFELAFRWQTNEFGRRVEQPNDRLYILAMATMEPNKCWYLIKLGNSIQLKKFEKKGSYSEFISKKNKIESSWLALLEEKESHEPVIPGNPNIQRDNSVEYLDNFRSVYCLDELIEIVTSLQPFNSIHIFELSGANVPLQSFLSKSFNGEIPISLLNSPEAKQQRELKKALFWINPDESLYMAEKERDAIKFILRKKGIDMDNIIMRYTNECTKEEFLKLYSDPSIDLIWISGHGKRDSNMPQRSSLKISNSDELFLSELANLSIPGKELGRRLVVLNMCETASVYVRYNSMDFLSISSVLTNEYQSVLGHMWPTHYLTSATFGSLLFVLLMEEQNWNHAISKAQYLISKGSTEIVNFIHDIYPEGDLEILDRIQNHQSIEMEIIANWGSSTYSC